MEFGSCLGGGCLVGCLGGGCLRRCDLPPPHPGSRTLTSLATHPSFTLYLAGLRLNGQLGEFIVPDTNLPSCKKYWIVLQRTHLKRFTLSLQIVDSPAPSHQPLLHWTLSSAVKNEEHPLLMASHPVCEPLLYIALICRAVQFNEI